MRPWARISMKEEAVMTKLKICFLFIVLSVIVFIPSIAVYAQDDSGFTYEESEEGYITITGYTGTDLDLVIPSSIGDKTVK